MKPMEQFRIINNPKDPEKTKVPLMPLIIALKDGTMGEAKTIRGAVAIVVGNQYFDAEDALDEWHERVEAARKETMKAIAWDRYGVIYDERQGQIEYNYAAAAEDPDYEIETDEQPINIRVDNDRLFLISLMQLGSIRVFEREDSYLLRPHERWIQEGPSQKCGNCKYQVLESDGEFICPVYNEFKKLDEGKDCSAFGLRLEDAPAVEEYRGGSYIDLAAEYDLEQLINVVGQKWIIDDRKIED